MKIRLGNRNKVESFGEANCGDLGLRPVLPAYKGVRDDYRSNH